MNFKDPEGWLYYFNWCGFDNHDDLDRLAIWLHLKSVDTQNMLFLQLVEEEQEHFLGQYESPADFAEESMGNAYGYEIDALPDAIKNAIDWSQVWDRYLRHDCIDYELITEDKYRWYIWHAH